MPELTDKGYRWIVTVRGVDGPASLPPYCREVATDGPWPDRAVREALDKITQGDNDLWQRSHLTIDAERVR